MESAPQPGKGFTEDDDDDDEDLPRRESSTHRGGAHLTIKVDGKGNEQKQPSTPRSKHSATEQRRRSKINDSGKVSPQASPRSNGMSLLSRKGQKGENQTSISCNVVLKRFQILRELLPNNDQKRDKASFLLEVIEYIRFLQEKVQKYEAYPGWNQENAKLLPWKLPRDSINGPAPSYMVAGKFDKNSISVSPSLLFNAQNPLDSELNGSVSYKEMEPTVFSTKVVAVPVPMQTNLYDDSSPQSQSQWLRSLCAADSTVNSATLKDQEELVIDNGMISVSNAYSQEVLTALTESLQSSGIDLSETSISVQINLGKRVVRRSAVIPDAKDNDGPSSGA